MINGMEGGSEVIDAYPIPKPITKHVTVKLTISCVVFKSGTGPLILEAG